LIARREWFTDRFGGLRYDVRRRVCVGEWRTESLHRWEFDLLDGAHHDETGWSFGWFGQRVSSPVSYRIHADGRFGVSAGGPFLEATPSIYHLVEGHALMDELFDWEPVPPISLDAWAPSGILTPRLRGLLDGLPPVAEASGLHDRWWRSDKLAIRVFDGWTAANPRPVGVMVWSRDGSAPTAQGDRPRLN
jgi:hypothetical protein